MRMAALDAAAVTNINMPLRYFVAVTRDTPFFPFNFYLSCVMVL